MLDNENFKKEKLLNLLANEDLIVLSQAYLYAKHLKNYGIDVSEKWETVTKQSAALNRAYIQGRYDESKRFEIETEREYE